MLRGANRFRESQKYYGKPRQSAEFEAGKLRHGTCGRWFFAGRSRAVSASGKSGDATTAAVGFISRSSSYHKVLCPLRNNSVVPSMKPSFFVGYPGTTVQIFIWASLRPIMAGGAGVFVFPLMS